MKFKHLILVLIALVTKTAFSQEILPVYSDYLSDNYFLLHPSMAGAANCGKVRLTGRQQWFGQQDAPALQTLSFNTSVSDKDGLGIILINDKNGYHSQKGFRVAYAHHIMFSRDNVDLNQLSFGINVGFAQSQLDESTFYTNDPSFDPIVFGQIQNANYFNTDIGASYNFLDFYAHFTVKNALASQRKLYTDKEPVDLKRLVYNMGYTFGDSEGLMFEPSMMFQYVFQTKESMVDFNLKAYKQMEFGKLWAVASYRRSLDGAQYIEGNTVATQNLQYITPILGVNYKNYMFSYTYSSLLGNIKFDNGGFHQFTLGVNLFCKPEKYHCNCPAVN
ncbi:type IX secretion system membrane protein PorP/SprF [Flavobacterium sp.]|jgi:type IX secretion system PorP/SprF family membrane protein|uniref:type IX secretion system membrane protein PorP/SprF n=1 Tax=Flavobacterium sp. TaxID=239 RepID=UPI0037C11560